MSNAPRITSREYKLMLKVNQFSNVADGTKVFWDRVKAIAKTHGASVVTPDKIAEIERETWYVDTPAPSFREQDCVLRGRKELSKVVNGVNKTIKRPHRLTLKFRDLSENAAKDRDVSAPEAALEQHEAKDDPKFEEDVLPGASRSAPPFRSKFATSNTLKAKKESVVDVKSFAAARERFTGLKDLGGLAAADKLEVVGRRYYELAHRIGKLDFKVGGATLQVKVCFTFWWRLTEEHSGPPRVAEFSFDYDGFPEEPVKAVAVFFAELQGETDWIDFDGTTKTSYAYQSALPLGLAQK